jgi:hypothetical protein
MIKSGGFYFPAFRRKLNASKTLVVYFKGQD